jgi:hypothetical protein
VVAIWDITDDAGLPARRITRGCDDRPVNTVTGGRDAKNT